jgi:imidazolonepropionase-like amidohydrolase
MAMTAECHGHIFLDGEDLRAASALHRDGPREDVVRARLEALARAGVTHYRDGGDPFGVTLLAARLAPKYGIDYRTPAFAIHRRGAYGAAFGRSYETAAELSALVAQAAEAGADFIKVMASGLMNFGNGGTVTPGGPTPEELDTLCRLAQREGLAVMAHVNGPERIAAALEAGVGSVEHGYGMDENCLTLLREKGAFWVPTLTPVANLLGRGLFPDTVLQDILDRQHAAIRKAAALGVSVACGSDAGAGCVPPAEGFRQEDRALTVLGVDHAGADAALFARFRRH